MGTKLFRFPGELAEDSSSENGADLEDNESHRSDLSYEGSEDDVWSEGMKSEFSFRSSKLVDGKREFDIMMLNEEEDEFVKKH